MRRARAQSAAATGLSGARPRSAGGGRRGRVGLAARAAQLVQGAAPVPTVWLLLAGAASGLLYSACFAPLNLWPLGWVALLPLLVALRRARLAVAPWIGLTAGAVGALATVRWLWLPLTHSYGFSGPAAAAFLLGISLYIGVFYAAFAVACVGLRRLGAPAPALWVPALWVAGEFARARLGVGVPWLFVGHTQVEVLPVVQVADLAGVFGIGALVVGVQQAAIEALGAPAGRRWPAPAAAAVVLLAVLAYGGWRLATLGAPLAPPTAGGDAGSPESRALRLAVVQPAIPQAEKWDRRYFAAGMRRLYGLTRDALRPVGGVEGGQDGAGERGGPALAAPDLVIWPETALTVDLEQAQTTLEPVLALLRGGHTSLLLGAPRLPAPLAPPAAPGRPAPPADLRNSAALFAPDGQRVGVYDKQVLLPFGEYYPAWVGRLPGLSGLMRRHMGEQEFSAGARGATLLSVGGVPFAVAICYEATYPEQIGAAVRQGARFLVNLTNDAWFERSAGAAQHLAMARLRAVEHRLPLVRAANTGISALVTPTGALADQLGLDAQGLLRATLRPGPGGAPYTRWGDRFAAGCVVLPLLLAGVGVVVRRRRPSLSFAPACTNLASACSASPSSSAHRSPA